MTEKHSSALGMSDADLESACRPGPTGLAPWIHWTSELYCFGKCIRAFAKYPRLLPLFVYADHGVALHSNLFPHEQDNSARVHFTFHPLKEQRYRSHPSKRIVRIPHPWIHYRRSRNIARLPNASGTLVFLPHVAPGFQWEDHGTLEYFSSLRSLPKKYQPIVLCLHMHDVNAGLHKELRHLGFPIVTAGNTSSVRFVDRFYGIVRAFSYATSQAWGSQVAFCTELGVPYFLFGKRPRLVNLSHKDLPLGEVGIQDEYHEEYARKAEALFSHSVDEVTADQKQFIERLLGLDSRTGRVKASHILWTELLRHRRECWSLYSTLLANSLRDHGIKGFVRRVHHRLWGNRP